MATNKKIVDPEQPHAPRTWQAQQGVKKGQYGDKKAAFRLPSDLCLLCGQLRDHAIHQ
jgi:uncharacterized protein YegP (UPF0339 family)